MGKQTTWEDSIFIIVKVSNLKIYLRPDLLNTVSDSLKTAKTYFLYQSLKHLFSIAGFPQKDELLKTVLGPNYKSTLHAQQLTLRRWLDHLPPDPNLALQTFR